LHTRVPLTRELLLEMDRDAGQSDLMRMDLCDPRRNEHAAAYFITRFCRTIDEEKGGAIEPIRDWPFVLRLISFLEENRVDGWNGLVLKSRRMLGTWVSCGHVLWRSQWIKGFPAFMTSGKGGDYVDDGGDHSTFKSVFGRFRFMWDRIPDYAKKPTDFAFKRITCVDMDAYISGEAPTEEAGRSGGYVTAFVDEAAHMPHSDNTHRALGPACRRGRLYVDTANGPNNAFARIVKTRPEGWRIHSLDWTEHPGLNGGLEDTPEHEIDRFGLKVSPKFREITADLRDEDIAQEYNHCFDRGARGLVFKEFQIRRHVSDAAIPYFPERPLVVGLDYGSTGFGAAVGGQMINGELNVLFDYELEGAGGAPAHAENLKAVHRTAGFRGEFRDVLLVGGPDTDTTQGSGQTNGGYYRAAGFLNIRQPFLRGPGSVDRGITVVCAALRRDRVRVSPACVHLIGRFGEYRWPVERGTGIVRRAKAPVHNEASHIMDAFRYLVVECFPREDAAQRFTSQTHQPEPVDVARTETGLGELMHDRPIMSEVSGMQF